MNAHQKIDVGYSYWGHRRKWRVRAFLPGADFNSFGRVLAEEWKATERSARNAAERMAREYGVTVREGN